MHGYLFLLSTAYNQYKCTLRKKDTKDATIKERSPFSIKC